MYRGRSIHTDVLNRVGLKVFRLINFMPLEWNVFVPSLMAVMLHLVLRSIIISSTTTITTVVITHTTTTILIIAINIMLNHHALTTTTWITTTIPTEIIITITITPPTLISLQAPWSIYTITRTLPRYLIQTTNWNSNSSSSTTTNNNTGSIAITTTISYTTKGMHTLFEVQTCQMTGVGIKHLDFTVWEDLVIRQVEFIQGRHQPAVCGAICSRAEGGEVTLGFQTKLI